jgi:uncharacterized protein (DUF1015 family)
MAVIKPFKALRPSKEAAPFVASVPYDVVDTHEAKELASGNKLNFLRVTRSEIELAENANPYSEEVYAKAKENLQTLKKEAPLIEDNSPCFYLYKLKMDGRSQVGIGATFSVDDYDNNVILKHEKTRKVKEDDRTNHITTTEAQTGAVFLTYRGIDAVNELVNRTITEEPAEYDFTTPDGVQHTLWVLPQKQNQLIINELAKADKLYIADGHHRAASASRARSVAKERNNNHNGDEDYNYFLAVLFPAEQLKILPYNRVLFNFAENYNKDFLIQEINSKFHVTKNPKKEPTSSKEFCMYIDKEWYTLKPRDSVLASLTLAASVAETLDVSILQDEILRPLFGIDDPRTSKNIDFVGGIRGTKELERIVDSGKAVAAFSLYAVTVDELMNISDAGEIMPPKSTWFEPKLRDGLLVHLI